MTHPTNPESRAREWLGDWTDDPASIESLAAEFRAVAREAQKRERDRCHAEITKQADKLFAWMETLKANSEARRVISIRCGEWYEAAAAIRALPEEEE